MDEYIKKADVLERFSRNSITKAVTFADGVSIYDTIKNFPTADVAEVKHGEWKHTVEKGNVYNHHFFNCSLCGASAFTSGYEKYCHECGAKMDGRSDT